MNRNHVGISHDARRRAGVGFRELRRHSPRTGRVDIVAKVEKAIQASGILSPGDAILVGVSGGPDSVALLHILLGLRHALGLSLHVAHFNHGWRTSAQADEQFVQRLARQWGVPCLCGRASGRLPGNSTSREEQGRLARFAFFRRASKKFHTLAVLLGHTQDDLVETVLMHILRGAGLQGMRGMLSCREVEGVYVIRPLLGISKENILRYLKKRRIAFRVDPTNRQTQFFRNQIRGELLPLLRKRYNENIYSVLSNLADTAGIDYTYIVGQAQKVFGRIMQCSPQGNCVRAAAAFWSQPEAIRRILIRLAIEHLQRNTRRITLTHVRAIDCALEGGVKKSVVALPGRIRVCVEKGRGIVIRRA